MNFKNIYYIFSTLLLVSSLSVVLLQNPIHSVIGLVISFLSSAGILFILQSEFFPLLFIIVYVGAIAVLFLFVIMMLDIKNLPKNKTNNLKHLLFGFFAAFSFLFFILSGINDFYYDKSIICLTENEMFDLLSLDYDYSQEDILTELEGLGQVVYTHYVLQFLISGLILSLAVVGVVILTIDMTAKNLPTNTKQVSRAPKL
jgi:NADH-quinone oxidoreductase subunit J